MIQLPPGLPPVRQEFAEDTATLNRLAKRVRNADDVSVRLDNGKFKTGEVGKWKIRLLKVVAAVVPRLRGNVKFTIDEFRKETVKQQADAVQHLNNMTINAKNPTKLSERSITVRKAATFIQEHPTQRHTAPKNTWVMPPTISQNWRPERTASKNDEVKIRDNLELEYRVYTSEEQVSKKLKNEMEMVTKQQEEMSKQFQALQTRAEGPEPKMKHLEKASLAFKKISDQRWVAGSDDIDPTLKGKPQGFIELGMCTPIDDDKKTPVARTVNFHSESATQSGVAHTTGRRLSMDDAVDCTSFKVKTQKGEVDIKMTAVYDGHGTGGDVASRHAKEKMVENLIKRLEEKNPDELSDQHIMNALKTAFVDTSNSFIPPEDKPKCGTTANVVLQINGNLWTANLGDSRAVLVARDGKVAQLSVDAKPEDDRFKSGVEKRGGKVYKNMAGGGKHVITGNAAVARDLGGHFNLGIFSARPKVTKLEKPEEGWQGYRLVQACDGLFDVANSDVVGGCVNQSTSQGAANAATAGQLAELAFRAGSMDNISVMVSSIDD